VYTFEQAIQNYENDKLGFKVAFETPELKLERRKDVFYLITSSLKRETS